MTTHTKKRLIEKGWSDEEAKKSVSAMQTAVKLKSKNILFVEKILYWLFLAIIIIANILVSMLLIPIFLKLSTAGVYLSAILLGLAIGALLDFMVRDIENLEKWHHYLALILIPVIAIISIILTGAFATQMYQSLAPFSTTFYQHSPWIVGIVYTVCLVLPYIIKEFVLKKK